MALLRRLPLYAVAALLAAALAAVADARSWSGWHTFLAGVGVVVVYVALVVVPWLVRDAPARYTRRPVAETNGYSELHIVLTTTSGASAANLNVREPLHLTR